MTTTPDSEFELWRAFKKSSFSGGTSCVQVAVSSKGNVKVRDSKLAADSPVLDFNRDEWTAFLAGVRENEFELPD